MSEHISQALAKFPNLCRVIKELPPRASVAVYAALIERIFFQDLCKLPEGKKIDFWASVKELYGPDIEKEREVIEYHYVKMPYTDEMKDFIIEFDVMGKAKERCR